MGEPTVEKSLVNLGFLFYLVVSDQRTVSGKVWYVAIDLLISGSSLLVRVRILLSSKIDLELVTVKRVRYGYSNLVAKN